MKILKPGDTCPCCGQPLPEGLPLATMLILTGLAMRQRRMEGVVDRGAE